MDTAHALNQAQAVIGDARIHINAKPCVPRIVINKTTRLFESTFQALSGTLGELPKLGPRGDEAKSCLHRLRSSLQEPGGRITTEGYLQEAAGRVQAATDASTRQRACLGARSRV